MLFFILKRVAMGVGLVLLVLTLIFSALQLVPGDPAVLLLSTGDGGAPSPEAVEKLREQLGLDQPLLTQYFSFLSGVFTGDLGESFRTSQPVLEAIGARLPRTLMLVVFATVLSIVIGVAMGAVAARRGGWVDTLVTALSSIGVALPVFVFGAVLILLFSITLEVVPGRRLCGPLQGPARLAREPHPAGHRPRGRVRGADRPDDAIGRARGADAGLGAAPRSRSASPLSRCSAGTCCATRSPRS